MDPTRRTLLTVGAAGALALALGGVGLALQGTVPRVPAQALRALDARSFSILAAIVDRLCPGGDGLPTAAEALVAEKLDALLYSLDPAVTVELSQLLRLTENALVGFAFEGRIRSFTALSPARLVDTRPWQPTVDGGQSGIGGVGPGGLLRVQVAGRGGVPASGAAAVVVNVTITQPSQATHLTVFPSGTAAPNASNLNASAGQTIANSVVAKLGADGSITIRNHAGWADVIVDVSGWFPAS